MTSLAQYDRARSALAEATRIEQVLPIIDEIEHVKLYARQIKDRALLAEATEFQMKTERRLGVIIVEAKKTGHFIQGNRVATDVESTGEELSTRATLEEVGVDKKLSAKAQKVAALSDDQFQAAVDAMRAQITAGKAITLEVGTIDAGRSIMASRAEPDDSLDYFPTPPWATRALLHHVLPHLGIEAENDGVLGKVWEPACGEGHISEVLRGYGATVYATDIFDYGTACQDRLCDFLSDDYAPSVKPGRFDWIITNPPFGDKSIGFVQRALKYARVGVAMFFRSQWAVEGIERYETIFCDRPPTLCAFFVERVNLCKGRWDPDGTTATAYCWLVWLKDDPQPRAPFWIPPGCRASLSLEADRDRFAPQQNEVAATPQEAPAEIASAVPQAEPVQPGKPLTADAVGGGAGPELTELEALETIDNERPLTGPMLDTLKAAKLVRGSVKPRLTKAGMLRLTELRKATVWVENQIPGPGYGPLEGAVETHGTQATEPAGGPANITVDCRVCADGSGICAQCLPAESHTIAMTSETDGEDLLSIATCCCGWRDCSPFASRESGEQDRAIQAHWQSVVDEARAADAAPPAAPALEGDGLGVPSFLRREAAE